MTGPTFGRSLPADRFLISCALLIESKLNWIVITDQPLLIILRQTETSEEKVRNIHTMVAMLREQGSTYWARTFMKLHLNWILNWIEYWQYYILEIKPCGLCSRIRDVEAFWYKTEIKIIYFVPMCFIMLIVSDCMIYHDTKSKIKYQIFRVRVNHTIRRNQKKEAIF